MADKYLIGAPVQGQNKPTPLREGDNILNAHLLVGEAGQVAPNIYIVRDEKYVRYDTLTEAKNDAVAGETIVVARGTYNEQDLLKDQVNWHFEEGVTLSVTEPEDIPKVFTDENTGPVTSKITGLLDIRTPEDTVLFPLLLVNGSNIEFSYRHSWGNNACVVNNGILSIEGKTGIQCTVTDGATYPLPGLPETPAQAWVEAKFENLDDATLMATGGEANFILSGGYGDGGNLVFHQGTGNVRIEDVHYRTAGIISNISSTEVEFTIVNSTLSGSIRSDSDITVYGSLLLGVWEQSVLSTQSIRTNDDSVNIDLTLNNTLLECKVSENVNVVYQGQQMTPGVTKDSDDYFAVYGPKGKRFVNNVTSPIENRINLPLVDSNILLDEYDNAMATLTSASKLITINGTGVRYLPIAPGNSYEFDKDGGTGRMTFVSPNGENPLFGDTPIVSGNRHTFIGFRFTDNLIVTGLLNVFINCTFSGISNIETAEFRDCTIETLAGIPNVDGIKMYNCTLQYGEFPEPINGGALINCIDGNGNLITAFSDD